MSFQVSELLEEATGLGLRVVAGESGRDRTIAVPRIQKPGLALAGYSEQLHDGRLLTLGGTEVEYLSSIDRDARARAFATVMASKPACIVVTRGLDAPQELVVACNESGTCLLSTSLSSADFIGQVTHYLEVRLAPKETVHGVLVDVLEVGILLLGKSGIGKSEAALDLVARGHRLVADDVVSVRLRPDGSVVGSSNESLGHHMEIRGLGIINIADLFGITAIRDSKRVDLVIELDEWQAGREYDRIGVSELSHELLGESIPLVVLPVKPGRNLSTLIEVAARNRLLAELGHNSARDFVAALDAKLARARAETAGSG